MNDLLHRGADILKRLFERLMVRTAAVEIVLADETSMRLQDRKKRGFVWVFHGHDDQSGGELVSYVFATDRSGQTPERILGQRAGALIVDGCTGYNSVTDPSGRARGGCWCHGRRKVVEAKDGAEPEANAALDQIRVLFRVEHEARVRGIVGPTVAESAARVGG